MKGLDYSLSTWALGLGLWIIASEYLTLSLGLHVKVRGNFGPRSNGLKLVTN